MKRKPSGEMMGKSESKTLISLGELHRSVRSKRTMLGLILILNTCVIFAYLITNKTKIVVTSRDLQTNRSIPPIIKMPEFCNGIETSHYNNMTSVKFSRATSEFVPKDRIIIVRIRTYSNRNIPKCNGGDVIFVWARQLQGDGAVPGDVIDHKNGSYTGFIRVFWIGRTSVYVKQVSAVENTCLRYKALNKYGDIVYTLRRPHGLGAVYFYNKTKALTPCNTYNFIYRNIKTCDFTDVNGGMSWYCGLPNGGQFNCEHLRSFYLGPFERSPSSVYDKIRYSGHGIFSIPMSVVVTRKSTTKKDIACNKRSPLGSWMERYPSGFFFKSKWIPTDCKSNLKHTAANYRSCLQNKTLIFLGDSTVRQYVNFFIQNVLELDITLEAKSTFGSNFETYHGSNSYTNYNIRIIYKKQAMPLHFGGREIPIKYILSFPQIIEVVAGSSIPDSSLILLLNYHAHFTAFPPEKYRERLKHLVISLQRLFISKPLAKVFFKGPTPCISNLKWWDPYISLVYKKILEEEFYDIKDKVFYLNVWEISVAHNVEDVHPHGKALESQLHQFMSFLC